ncbi:MAG: polymerase subunit beta [Firmicutes bacterium]|nr:polymerase subunit beta [Bacillota bacterium]
MKFSCEKAILQNAIATAARAVSPKSSIPALEGLLLEAETLLAVTGYNLETGIRSTMEAEIEKPGSLVLPARLFGDIIRKLPDDIVTFSADKLQVNIRCGPASFNLIAMDPDDFPLLPSVDYQHSFTISERTLRAMISETLFAVSDNESRPIHTGSLFEVEPDTLTMVSVDGFRLALRREALHESEGSFQFVVPGSALSEVEKICRDADDPVIVTMGARHTMFQFERAMLVSRRLEGEFLAWRKAIPRENPIKVMVEARELLTSIERVSLIISDKLKSPLRCTVGEGELQLVTKTSVSDAADTCVIEGDGKGLEIGFNNKYVMDALKAVPADKVHLEFNSGVSPCVISPLDGEEENFLYMILPVRLKAGE